MSIAGVDGLCLSRSSALVLLTLPFTLAITSSFPVPILFGALTVIMIRRSRSANED